MLNFARGLRSVVYLYCHGLSGFFLGTAYESVEEVSPFRKKNTKFFGGPFNLMSTKAPVQQVISQNSAHGMCDQIFLLAYFDCHSNRKNNGINWRYSHNIN